jgi:lysine decarboxylase
MKQEKTPVLDALADYHRSERYGFSPPGHRQGRGADERALAVLGKDPFRDDVLASGGLDDRMSRGGYLTAAEDLMAEAVGAQTAFFSTCGSSLSVKAAMMAVAGGSDGGLLLSRDSHKSVVAGSSCPVCTHGGSRRSGMPTVTSPIHRHPIRCCRHGRNTPTRRGH